jgi:hypothetical protein
MGADVGWARASPCRRAATKDAELASFVDAGTRFPVPKKGLDSTRGDRGWCALPRDTPVADLSRSLRPAHVAGFGFLGSGLGGSVTGAADAAGRAGSLPNGIEPLQALYPLRQASWSRGLPRLRPPGCDTQRILGHHHAVGEPAAALRCIGTAGPSAAHHRGRHPRWPDQFLRQLRHVIIARDVKCEGSRMGSLAFSARRT